MLFRISAISIPAGEDFAFFLKDHFTVTGALGHNYTVDRDIQTEFFSQLVDFERQHK